MKKIISILALTLSFSAISSTTDTKTFVYDGTQNSVELVLRAEKTHTEYNVEDVISTCYRTEIAGHRTICTGTTYPGPYYPGPYYPGPHRVPGPYSRQCYSEPMYRQVPYSCMQTVRLPYQQKDFDVEARVIVDVTKLSNEITTGETFKVSLEGDTLVFTASGSKKFFIVKKKQDIRSSMNGSVKMIDALYVSELVEAGPVLAALNMTNIAVENSSLKFKLGVVESLTNLGFSLKVVQNKFLASDKTIFDRELNSSEIQISTNGSESEATVELGKLGISLNEGKFSLTAKASAKFEGSLMNLSQFNELSASRTLIYKAR